MSHWDDPSTSKDAATRTVRGRKLHLIRGAIIGALQQGPATPREVLARYEESRDTAGEWLPVVDVYDIRRRMTELEHDFERIVPVGRRNGERVMSLVGES